MQMKLKLPAALALTLPLLACAQLEWRRLDGAAVDEQALQQARQTCRIERKLTALERAREERDSDLGDAGSNQAKMTVKDEFAEVERQVYREIDTCMSQQGYRR